MEEPPKIERILSSRGVSLSDAASLLKSFLSNIDQYHGRHDDEGGDLDDALDGGGRRREELAYEDDNVEGRGKRGGGPRKSWHEREEEALIAQMDQLANGGNSASGISDDVLERLRVITGSICAEVEGRPLSASGMMTSASRKDGATDAFKEEEEGDDIGADDFLAVSGGGGDSLAREERRRQQQQQQQQKKDKKKEKKAKKAAKKAKKDAKSKRAF